MWCSLCVMHMWCSLCVMHKLMLAYWHAGIIQQLQFYWFVYS
eukprot:COSAG02_NODE_6599_length_3469_cov_82.997758_2_plen_42_part_00